ncbi:cyclin-D6-1-like [Ananas comosus]|uniref:Cyclin-D6-1-like n=1 Tax=Ananas comosus TaxID=4615 RepID=A0A6P5FMG1_ANACO|nr:cyclin-D6-1-like [Ananas comosus]
MPSSSSSSNNNNNNSSSRIGNLHHHLPFRRSTIDLILQAVSLGTVDHTVAYLAINYLDRYIARRGSPSDKEWVPGFVAVSCLSIASKMMHPKFSLLRLLRDTNSWFAAETVGRMEKLILCALEWRTRSITPFAFLRYFLASNSAPSSHFHSVVRKRAIAIFARAQRGIPHARTHARQQTN